MNILYITLFLLFWNEEQENGLFFDFPTTRCAAFLEVETPNTSRPPLTARAVIPKE